MALESIAPIVAGSVGVAAGLGFSARWNWWRPRAAGVPVLMYHKIGDPPPGSRLKKLWVSTAQFRRQMAYLKENGHAPITFFDVASHVDAGRPIPSNAVIITFDDGYRNIHENALPVLREFGFKAVIYLVVQAIGWDNFWHDPSTEIRIPMLSWKEVEDLQAGGFEIGSHTMTHPRMGQMERKAAAVELEKSRKTIAEFAGKEPVSFAYPYGNGADLDWLQKLVGEAGYRWAVSVHQGKADFGGDPFCLKRLFIRGDDLDWDFHLNMTRGRSRL
jgi:peptidoglycan/xylan/chitin deacetylase (PgdA/CDA1 family)